MNKVQFKKMLEAVAHGRDLKQLFDKDQIKQFIIKQAIRIGMKLITPILPYILIAAVIIGTLLAVFIVFFDEIVGLWGGITNAWGHLWSGTASQVSDDDISQLYYDLLQQGVDFEEIGAVGEHNYIEEGKSFIDYPTLHNEVEDKLNTDNEREKYTLQYYLDNVKDTDLKPVKIDQSKIDYVTHKTEELSDTIQLENKLDANGQPVLETKREAAARMLSEKLLVYKEEKVAREGYTEYNKLDANKSVGMYLKKYLEAEKETFSIRNNYTLADERYKGAIYIDTGEEGDIIYELLSNVIPQLKLYSTLGEMVFPTTLNKRADGRMTIDLNKETTTVVNSEDWTWDSKGQLIVTERTNVDESFDVTEHVKDYAMPWQYPFAFHQQTLSPDVGYEVALMAHKYHNLYLQVRNVETGVVKVFDEEGNFKFQKSIMTPKIFVSRQSTWYQTIDYNYSENPNSSWHGKADGRAKNYKLNSTDLDLDTLRTTYPNDVVNITSVIIKKETTQEIHEHCFNGDLNGPNIIAASKSEYKPPNGYSDDLSDDHYYGDEPRLDEFGEETGEYDEIYCDYYTRHYYTYEKQYVVECKYEYDDDEPFEEITDTKARISGIDKTGVVAMTELLLPDPIDKTNKKIRNIDENTEEKPPMYYRANNMKQKDYLFISTSAQNIIKSLYDLYDSYGEKELENEKVETVEYDKMVQDKQNGKSTFINEDDSWHMTGNTPKYLSLAGNYKPVVELIQFFAENDIIDSSDIGGPITTNPFVIAAQWFISGNINRITSDGNIATINTGSGKEVSVPIDGTISIVEGTNYICIQNAKYGTVYLGNVQISNNIQMGQTVSKGQVIGETIGDVTYCRTDGAGQVVTNVAHELRQLQEIKLADYAWPVPSSGNITSNYGERIHPITKKSSIHHGIDIGAAEGTPIVAYMDGEIVVAQYNPKGYGNYLQIKHSDDCYTLYAHMSMFAKKSGTVKKGEVIGYVGSTGMSTGPHLHFEYRTGSGINTAINPISKLSNYSSY